MIITLHRELIEKNVCGAERSTNAADVVHVIHVVRALVSVRVREWDYLLSDDQSINM